MFADDQAKPARKGGNARKRRAGQETRGVYRVKITVLSLSY